MTNSTLDALIGADISNQSKTLDKANRLQQKAQEKVSRLGTVSTEALELTTPGRITGYKDADTPVIEGLGSLRTTPTTGKYYDAAETQHGTMEFGKGKSDASMAAQQLQAAAEFGIPSNEVTDQHIAALGNQQMVQQLFEDIRTKDMADWKAPLITPEEFGGKVVPTDLSAKTYGPLGGLADTNLVLKGNTDDGRPLGSTINPNTMINTVDEAALDTARNASLYRPGAGTSSPLSGKEIRAQVDKELYGEKSYLDQLIDLPQTIAAGFGKAVYDTADTYTELAGDAVGRGVGLIDEKTGIAIDKAVDLGTDAEKTKRVNEFVGYDNMFTQQNIQEVSKLYDEAMEKVELFSPSTWSNIDISKLADAASTAFKDIETAGYSIGYMAPALVGAFGKAGAKVIGGQVKQHYDLVADNLKKVSKGTMTKEVAQQAATESLSALSKTDRTKLFLVNNADALNYGAMMNNNQMDEYIEANGGDDATLARAIFGTAANAVGMKLDIGIMDAIIKPSKGTAEAIGNWLKGIGEDKARVVLGKVGEMTTKAAVAGIKETPQEWTQTFIEEFNKVYGTKKEDGTEVGISEAAAKARDAAGVGSLMGLAGGVQTSLGASTVSGVSNLKPNQLTKPGTEDTDTPVASIVDEEMNQENTEQVVSAAREVLANAKPAAEYENFGQVVEVMNNADVLVSKGTTADREEYASARAEAFEEVSSRLGRVFEGIVKDEATKVGVDITDEAAVDTAIDQLSKLINTTGLSKETKAEVLGNLVVNNKILGAEIFSINPDMLKTMQIGEVGTVEEAEPIVNQINNINMANLGKISIGEAPQTDTEATANVQKEVQQQIKIAPEVATEEVVEDSEPRTKQDETYTYGTSKGTIGKLGKALGLDPSQVDKAINSAFGMVKIRKMAAVGKAANSKQRELYYGKKDGFKGIVPTFVAFKKALKDGEVEKATSEITNLQKVGTDNEVAFKKLKVAYDEINSAIADEVATLTAEEIEAEGGIEQVRLLIAKGLPKSKKFDGVVIDPIDVAQNMDTPEKSIAMQEIANRFEVYKNIDTALQSESKAFIRAGDQGRVVTLEDDLREANKVLGDVTAEIDALTATPGKKSKIVLGKLNKLRDKKNNYTEKVARLAKDIETKEAIENGEEVDKDARYVLNTRWVSVTDKDESPEIIEWIKNTAGLGVEEKVAQDQDETPTTKVDTLEEGMTFTKEEATGETAKVVDKVEAKIATSEVKQTVEEIAKIEEEISAAKTEQVKLSEEVEEVKQTKEGRLLEILKTEDAVIAYKKADAVVRNTTKQLEELAEQKGKAQEQVDKAKKALQLAEKHLGKAKDRLVSSVTDAEIKVVEEALQNQDKYEGTSNKLAQKLKVLATQINNIAKWTASKIREVLAVMRLNTAKNMLEKAERELSSIRALEEVTKKDRLKAGAKRQQLVKEADGRRSTKSAIKLDTEIQKYGVMLNRLYEAMNDGRDSTLALQKKKRELLSRLKGSKNIEKVIDTGAGSGVTAIQGKEGSTEEIGLQPLDLKGVVKVEDSIVGQLNRDELVSILPNSVQATMKEQFNKVQTAMSSILAVRTVKGATIDNFQLKNSPATALASKKGLVDGEPQLQEEFVTAATLVINDFAGTGLPDLVQNTWDDIARLREKHNAGMLNEGEKALLKRGGFKKVMADKLAVQVLNTMGIKAGEIMQQEHFDKLKADIGQMLLLTMQEMGYIEPLKSSVISEFDWETRIEEMDEDAVIARINSRKDKTDRPIGMVYAKKSLRDTYKQLAELSKKVNEALDLEPFKKNYLERPPREVEGPATVKGSFSEVPKESTKILDIVKKEEYTLNLDGMSKFKEMFKTKEEYLEARGWQDTDKMITDGIYTQDAVDTQEGQNRGLEAEYDALMELNDKVVGKQMKNSMWFDWFFSKNGRFFLDSVGINPQTSKNLHRWLVVPASASRKWDMEDGIDKLEFQIAITQAMGFDIDKESTEAIEKEFNRLTDSKMTKAKLLEIAQAAPHPGHAAMALSALDKYVVDGTFEAVMAAEFDAVTSGFAIKLLQLPLLGDTYRWLAKTGIFKLSKELGIARLNKNKLENNEYGMNDIIGGKIGFLDAYKSLAFGTSEEGVNKETGRLDVKDAEGTILKKETELLRLLQDSSLVDRIAVDNIVTSFGRSLFKAPFMTFNYAASIKSIRKSLSASLTGTVIDAVMSNKELDAEMLKLIGLSDTKARDAFRNTYKAKKDGITKDITKSAEYRKLMTVFDGAYGRVVEDYMGKEFADLVRANEIITDSTQVMFQAFKLEYDKAVDKKVQDKKKDNKVGEIEGLTKVEVLEVVKSLAHKFPLIKAPNSEAAIDGIAVVAKKNADASSKLLGNAQTTIKATNEKGYETLVIQAMTKEFDQARAAGAVLPIHWIDGTIIGEVLKKGGILGVHDAIVVYNNYLANAKDMNKATLEVNKNYNLLEAIVESLDSSLDGMNEEEMNKLIGDSGRNGIEVMQDLLALTEDNNAKRAELHNSTLMIGNIAGSAGSMYKAEANTNEYEGILLSKELKNVNLDEIITQVEKECK